MVLASSLRLNGVRYEYKNGLLIGELIEYLGFNLDIILVDYNGTIIQRDSWHKIAIANNDTFEILTLAGGG